MTTGTNSLTCSTGHGPETPFPSSKHRAALRNSGYKNPTSWVLASWLSLTSIARSTRWSCAFNIPVCILLNPKFYTNVVVINFGEMWSVEFSKNGFP